MAMSSAMLTCSFIGRSDVYIFYKMGDRREPCGTPDCIVFAKDVEFSILILKRLLLSQYFIISISCFEKPNLNNTLIIIQKS